MYILEGWGERKEEYMMTENLSLPDKQGTHTMFHRARTRESSMEAE